MRIPLTKYGLREILVGSAVFAVGCSVAGWLYWPAALAVGLLWAAYLAFFRDPERRIPEARDSLLSPADGTVYDICEVDPPGEFLGDPALRIGIFMSVLNCHVNRSPAEGKVRYVQYFPGSFLDARNPDASTRNEHNLFGLETEGGRRLMVNQISGAVARRIVCDLKPGNLLKAGQRVGMVKFGSRVELFVPESDKVDVDVQPGDRVKAGLSVLATYVRE